MDRGLIFDCDGVLADTELHGHLVAFNQMWKQVGVRWQWSPEQYAEKLKIGGGKERMASLFLEPAFQQIFVVPESEEDREAVIARWHKEKTAIYQQIIASGAIPPRSGVKRIAEAALAEVPREPDAPHLHPRHLWRGLCCWDALPAKSRALQDFSRNGASRARTGDLLGAIQALSQLSYSPVRRLKTARTQPV